VADDDAARGQQLLNHAQPEREPVTEACFALSLERGACHRLGYVARTRRRGRRVARV